MPVNIVDAPTDKLPKNTPAWGRETYAICWKNSKDLEEFVETQAQNNIEQNNDIQNAVGASRNAKYWSKGAITLATIACFFGAYQMWGAAVTTIAAGIWGVFVVIGKFWKI